jgi:hypothetical protein
MDITIIIFLLGGLFLGWSLGANDAANVFGTAVGTRMVRFKTAAIVCSIFVILGAIISGAGTTETLGKLGAINALPGAFAACVAAGIIRVPYDKSGFTCIYNTSHCWCHCWMEFIHRVSNQYKSVNYNFRNMGSVSCDSRINCHGFFYPDKKFYIKDEKYIFYDLMLTLEQPFY